MLITSGATETDVATQNDKEIKQTNKKTNKSYTNKKYLIWKI